MFIGHHACAGESLVSALTEQNMCEKERMTGQARTRSAPVQVLLLVPIQTCSVVREAASYLLRSKLPIEQLHEVGLGRSLRLL